MKLKSCGPLSLEFVHPPENGLHATIQLLWPGTLDESAALKAATNPRGKEGGAKEEANQAGDLSGVEQAQIRRAGGSRSVDEMRAPFLLFHLP